MDHSKKVQIYVPSGPDDPFLKKVEKGLAKRRARIPPSDDRVLEVLKKSYRTFLHEAVDATEVKVKNYEAGCR